MNDDKINDEILIKTINTWELSRQDVQDLLNKMDKIIKN